MNYGLIFLKGSSLALLLSIKLSLSLLSEQVLAANPSEHLKSIENTKKAHVYRVLHIDSYHRGFTWSDNIKSSLQNRFKESDYNIEVSTEYLDAMGIFVFGVLLREK